MHAEVEHEAGAGGDDEIDERHEPRLHAARPQRRVDAREALPIQPALLEVLPRERLDDARRRQRFLDHGREIAGGAS